MKEILMQTYTVALPIVLGYIVWLLKRQKRDRDANSKGTMLLLRVQLIDYHDKYMEQGNIPSEGIFINILGVYKRLLLKKMPIRPIRKLIFSLLDDLCFLLELLQE